MKQINVTFFEGLFVVAMGMRFLFEPLGAMMLALGGLLTLFQNPFDHQTPSRRFLVIRRTFGMGVLTVAAALLLIAAFAPDSLGSGTFLATIR